MKFTNVRETKEKLTEYLRIANNGEDVIITYRGKPYAVIKKITEDEIEDYILANHQGLKKKLKEAYREAKQGKGKTLEKLAEELGIEL